MITYSFIIPFHKDQNMLKLSLKTLEKTVPDNSETIIVANNVNPYEINLDSFFSKYKVVKRYENLFYPKAVNLGVSLAIGKYIVICDPDLFYWENWFLPLATYFTNHKDIGAVSSKIVNPLTNRIMDFGMAYNQYNVIHTTMGLKYDHPLASFDREVQAACGAVTFTTKHIFDKVGGIDESMPYIYCDNDFNLKLIREGLSNWVISDSIVYHKGNTDKNNSKYYAFSYLREDSKAAFYEKNGIFRKIDFADWFEHVWKWYCQNTDNRQKNYLLLNLSTMYEFPLYQDIFINRLHLNIYETYHFTIDERNIPELALYHYIPVDLIDSAIPFIYFVDNFTSLFNNKIWFNLRNIYRDLVIDRHGNIINMRDIAMEQI